MDICTDMRIDTRIDKDNVRECPLWFSYPGPREGNYNVGRTTMKTIVHAALKDKDIMCRGGTYT